MYKIFKRVIATLRVIITLKNWVKVIYNQLFKHYSDRFLLRNGIEIRFPVKQECNLLIIYEIFINKDYTKFYDVEKDDIVVDIGANVGVFTLYAVSKNCKQVYSFEPFPSNVKAIENNININHVENVTLETKAIADKEGVTKLYVVENNCGGHLIFNRNIKKNLTDYIEVDMITFPDIIKKYNLSKIDFLKIDCEGSEGYIFKTLTKDHYKIIRKIAIEFHDNVSILNHQQIISLLEDNGFATILKWNGTSKFGYIYAINNNTNSNYNL